MDIKDNKTIAYEMMNYTIEVDGIHEIQRQIGTRLKSVRKERGLSQRDVGKMIGSNHYFISQIERGLVSLRIKHLYILANIYNVDVKDLLP